MKIIVVLSDTYGNNGIARIISP